MKLNKFFGVLMAVAAFTFAFTSCNKDNDVIKLKANQITLNVGESYTIPVEKASGDIVWASQNAQIATVDAKGLVQAVAVGQTAITATVGKAVASVAVIVEEGGAQGGEAPDLEKPADGMLMVVIEIPEGTECNGIALKGTFDGENWSGENTYLGEEGAATPVDGPIYKFTTVPMYDNWYGIVVPATQTMQFKVCLIYSGDGSWQGQATDVAFHDCNFSTVEPAMSGDGQCNFSEVEGFNGGLLYLSIGGWQKSECVVEEEVLRTVFVTVPGGEGFEIPSIVGSFNDWDATAIPMTLAEGNKYFAQVYAVASDEFKFAGSVSGWENEIEMYNATDDTWSGLGNMKFGAETDFNFDYSDSTLYRWKKSAPAVDPEPAGE